MPNNEQKPTVLFPLRLEIRHIQNTGNNSKINIVKYEGDQANARIFGKKQLNKLPQTPPIQNEIWIRWYPDECQIFPIIKENVNSSGDKQPIQKALEEGFELKIMPGKVKIYAVVEDKLTYEKEITYVTEGKLIDTNEIVFGSANHPKARWMVDFEDAVNKGMGVKITDAKMYKQVIEAQWLIAVGHKTDAENMIEDLITRHRKLGDFDLLKQDSQTNNFEGNTPYSILEKKIYNTDSTGTTPTGTPLNSEKTDGEILAATLGVNKYLFDGLENATLTEQISLKQIKNLLWPACTNYYRSIEMKYFMPDGRSYCMNEHLDDWNRLYQHFRNYVSSRGLQIRLGKNPYGILVATDNNKWESADDENPSKEIENKISTVCNVLKKIFLRLSDETARIDVENYSDSFDTLTKILQLNAVSYRTDIQIFDKLIDYNKAPERLTCPLVAKSDDNIEALKEINAYLKIINQSNGILPSESDTNMSLFQRMILNSARFIGQVQDVTSQEFNDSIKYFVDQTNSGNIKITPQALEILIMEFLDLLSYRLDAWLTSFAHLNLERLQKLNNSKNVGVFGMLEKPSAIIGQTTKSKGYFQAPSLNHAAAGSIVLSAALSGKPDESEFSWINLSSERVKKALWFIEGLQKGYTRSALLGYNVERKLHELKLDKYVFDLRKKYSASDQDSNELHKYAAVVDGVKFMNSKNDKDIIDSKDRQAIDNIRDEVRQITDAVSDLLIYETMYHRVLNNTAKEEEMLSAVEGKKVIQELESIKTSRNVQNQVQRVIFPVPNVTISDNEKNIRVIAEPVISKFCDDHLKNYDSCIFSVTIIPQDKKYCDPLEFKFSPVNDFGFRPVDIVTGGTQELETRVNIFLWIKFLKERTNWKLSIDDFNGDSNFLMSLLTGNIIRHDTDGSEKYVFNENIKTINTLNESLINNNIQNTELVLNIWKTKNQWRFLGKDYLESPDKDDWENKFKIDFDYTYINGNDVPFALFIEGAKSIQQFVKSASPLTPEDIIDPNVLKHKEIIAQKKQSYNLLFTRIQKLLGIFNSSSGLLKIIEDKKNEIAQIVYDNASNKEAINNKILEIQEIFINPENTGLPFILMKLPFVSSDNHRIAVVKVIEEILNKFTTVYSLLLYSSQLSISFKESKLNIKYENNDLIIETGEAWLSITDYFNTNKNKYDVTHYVENDKYNDLEIVEYNVYNVLINNAVELLQKNILNDSLKVLSPFIIGRDFQIPPAELKFNEEKRLFSDRFSSYLKIRKRLDYANRILDSDTEVFSINGCHLSQQMAFMQAISASGNPDIKIDDIVNITNWPQSNTDFHYVFKNEENFKSSEYIVGFKIDEWTDVIPDSSETTGIGFQYETSQAEAPQILLVAVPARINSGDPDKELADIIANVIDLMRIRAVSSEQVAGSSLGNILPALLFEKVVGANNECLFPHSPLPLFNGLIKGGFQYITTKNPEKYTYKGESAQRKF
jgi:hypothetical protein